jgi:hypothetical protein
VFGGACLYSATFVNLQVPVQGLVNCAVQFSQVSCEQRILPVLLLLGSSMACTT